MQKAQRKCHITRGKISKFETPCTKNGLDIKETTHARTANLTSDGMTGILETRLAD